MKAIRHIGVVVSDMEKSLRFYRDLLGLKVEKIMDESGGYIDNMLGLQNVRATTVTLSADNGAPLLELLKFESHICPNTGTRNIFSLGPSHVALTVDNLDEVYRTMLKAGIRFNAPPQHSPDGYTKVTFCLDPDGTPVELVQVLQ